MSLRQNFPYIGAIYLLMMRDEKILLLQRANTSYYDGRYSLPAWHMDGHELPTEAMIREAYEELGITIRPEWFGEPLTLFRMAMQNNGNGERFEFFFPLTQWEWDIVNNEPDKCSDLRRFPLDALPDETIPYIREVIEAQQSGKKFLEIKE